LAYVKRIFSVAANKDKISDEQNVTTISIIWIFGPKQFTTFQNKKNIRN